MGVIRGELHGQTSGLRDCHVGAFCGPRIRAQPVAWTVAAVPGPFGLNVPPGRWYLHGVAGPTDRFGFLSGLAWGSNGGIYGYGRPVEVQEGMEPIPVRLHLSPLWRDLTHLPQIAQPALTQDQWQAIFRTLGALAEQLDSPVGGGLNQSAHLGRSRLAALFKRGMGVTLEEFRTRLRLEAAKAMLLETDRDVLSIALSSGYATSAQLGRVFQRFLGVSPGEFRRLARAVAEGSGGEPVRSPGWSDRLAALLAGRTSHAGEVRGEVFYRGGASQGTIYVGLFPRKVPDTYPYAWCALPAPGPFTIRAVPAGRFYVLACYCRRRMLFPGDIGSAFAYGGYGDTDPSGTLSGWDPISLHLHEGEQVGGLTVELTDGYAITRFARPWTDIFLPDGR